MTGQAVGEVRAFAVRRAAVARPRQRRRRRHCAGLRKLDDVNGAKATGLAVVFAVVKPKNLLLMSGRRARDCAATR